MNVSGRLSRLVNNGSAEFVLILRVEDIRWLTGFTGGTAQLLVSRSNHEAWLLVDGRYFERAVDETTASRATVNIERVVPDVSTDEMIARIVGTSSVAVDPTHLTAHFMTVLQSHCSVVHERTQLDDLRRVKDEAEISLIASAASIADNALLSVVTDGFAGKTEKQTRNRLDHLMLRPVLMMLLLTRLSHLGLSVQDHIMNHLMQSWKMVTESLLTSEQWCRGTRVT